MKRRKTYFLFVSLLIVLGMSSCIDPMNSEGFDINLLYGKWQEGSVYERYDETGLGATWDTDDDIGEEEAQLFKWTLEGSTLIHEHIGTFVTVPKVYTIQTLNTTQLVYGDDYGKTHYFTKVK